jgi:hypothetical protein
VLVLAGAVVWIVGPRGLPGLLRGDAALPPPAAAAPFDPRTARALKLPPRPSAPDKAAPEKGVPEKTASESAAPAMAAPEKATPEKPEPAPAAQARPPVPAPAKTGLASPSSSPAETEAAKPDAPAKTVCKVDPGRWPTDKSDQGQAVQVLLRELGLYRGTTNGTVGPQTRAAIREFQLAAGEAETGELSEALFEALRKKCAAASP